MTPYRGRYLVFGFKGRIHHDIGEADSLARVQMLLKVGLSNYQNLLFYVEDRLKGTLKELR